MTDASKMMGYKAPDDQKFSVPVRDWQALKLALWRSRTALEIAMRESAEILSRCKHTTGCDGESVETEPCLPTCPDREVRMSALVILNAARQLAPANARKPANAPYHAPSRERFSEVMAELVALTAAYEELRASLPQPPQLSQETAS